jgi:hypothetical protein
VLCVVNHQRGLAWQLREKETAISPNAKQIASLSGITLVTTADLMRLVLGVEEYGWDAQRIKRSLSMPGRCGEQPPNCEVAGIVHHFYSNVQVVSVDVSPNVTIQNGDKVIFCLADRYFSQVVESMQINRYPVTAAHGGQRVGIKTPLHRSDLVIGSMLFIERIEDRSVTES